MALVLTTFLLSFPRSSVTAIKLRIIVNKADSYVDKSPLPTLFQRGELLAFALTWYENSLLPLEKGD
jgi:hypothetical protein